MRIPVILPRSAGRRWRRSPQAQRKGLTLHLDAPSTATTLVLLDADAVRQIASNLLANAVKFSDVGGIELRLQLTPPRGRGNCCWR